MGGSRRAIPFVAVILLVTAALYYPIRGASAATAYSIEINIPAFRLYLFRNGQLLHDYPVAVGRPANPTPVGSFSIINKVRDPTWYPETGKPVPPGPANPLGRWWFGLSARSYGIHGCADENSIGNPASKGCIRMHNRDVAELAQYVGVGVPVNIVYRLFECREDELSGRLWLWMGEDVYRRAPAGSLAEAALMYLEGFAVGWHTGAARQVLAGAGGIGWREIPRPVAIYDRRNYLGDGYWWEGKIWLPGRLAQDLARYAGITTNQGADIALDELAEATSETIDWRYEPRARVLIARPARLRAGERCWYDAVRVAQGRVMIRGSAAAEAAACAAGDKSGLGLTESGGWVPLGEISLAGLSLRWDAEEWEVVMERVQETVAPY